MEKTEFEERKRNIKRDFFFIVLPLLLVLYFIGFQKYSFTETYTKNNESFVEVLTQNKVKGEDFPTESCKNVKNSTSCGQQYTYKTSLPKYVYLKLAYYAYY